MDIGNQMKRTDDGFYENFCLFYAKWHEGLRNKKAIDKRDALK